MGRHFLFFLRHHGIALFFCTNFVLSMLPLQTLVAVRLSNMFEGGRGVRLVPWRPHLQLPLRLIETRFFLFLYQHNIQILVLLPTWLGFSHRYHVFISLGA